MRDHKATEIHDATDSYIRRTLKNWAAKQQPPTEGRARLLLVASATTSRLSRFSEQRENKEYVAPHPTHQPPSYWTVDSINRNVVWPIDLTLIPLRHGA